MSTPNAAHASPGGRMPGRRRTAKADPRLDTGRLFDAEINRQLAAGLPEPLRSQRYFSRATMPDHWLEAILENQASYQAKEKSVALNFRDLPEPIAIELIWATERQVQLGMRLQAQNTCKLARLLSLVLATTPRDVVSLLDLTRDEWIHEIVKARIKAEIPLRANQTRVLGSLLGRFLDLLVHVYHRGAWWELNVWNPLLDTRIPLREHEPQRNHLVYFSHLTTPWLREGAKWWLSRQLEREIYTWSTVLARRSNLGSFQRYIDIVGCDGPHLVSDPRRLGAWVQEFRGWLRRQTAGSGPRVGKPLGEIHRRAAMTALEQLYRFMFEEGGMPDGDLGWEQLQPHHAVLFRFGDKPSGPRAPAPELVLSDTVLTRIAEGSELLARPRSEGGFDDEQLVRILGLLLRVGRRVKEVTMLDFDPLLPIPFPDPDGHAARLRYQQTKIDTGDATILVDQEVVDLIRTQQQFAREFMARQGRAEVPVSRQQAKPQRRSALQRCDRAAAPARTLRTSGFAG